MVIENALTGAYGANITRNGDYVQYSGPGGRGSTLVCFEIGGLIVRRHGTVSLMITHRYTDKAHPDCQGLPNPGPR